MKKTEEVKITARCPIKTTSELLGGKWKLLILHQLSNEGLRPSELRRLIPDISEKMLIQELKMLCTSGLVSRINFEQIPPKVVYEISEVGKNVIPLISEMRNFGLAYERELKN